MLLLGLVDVPVWLMLVVGIIIGLYLIGTRNHNYFTKRGIPGPKPLPFIGSTHLFFKDIYNLHAKWKTEYGKVCGMFVGAKPTYVIFDEEMISQVCVKQFSKFGDRNAQKSGDNVFDHGITVLKGEHWKHVRSQMSPAFTTGKLRVMTTEINRGGKALVKNILSKSGEFEARSVAAAFTMDVIASTAFGLRLESQESEDNVFMKMGKALTTFSLRNPAFFAMLIFPKALPLMIRMGFSIIDKTARDFFVSILNQTFEGRAEQAEGPSKADFIQLMVEAKQGHDISDDHEKQQKDATNSERTKFEGMSKDEILSNALLFFFAGYDTTSAGLSFLMYDLACNSEAQDKLIREIDSVVGDKEEISYDAAMKLQYLDQCIQESLRLQSPAILFDRVANCDTEVCGVAIDKDAVVAIPVRAIHHDPDIWPEPLTYNPDRFSPENKVNISPFHWMPFGYGPRNCIGMRLALFEMKVAIATLLKSYKLTTCEKTEIPLKLSKKNIMKPENGIFLTVEKR